MTQYHPPSRQDGGGPRGQQDAGAPSKAPSSTSNSKGWYSRNYLPHLDAPGIVQSITIRLHDALPKEVIERLEEQQRLKMITDVKKRRSIEAYMDAGHGQCWLKEPAVARMVEATLHHFDGERYRLLAWCIMPNHLHAMIETFAVWPLAKVMHSWKSFSARCANTILKRHGAFWQRDYFDRYVRDADHYERLIHYIEHNPVKAGLVKRPEEWLYSSIHGRER